jgi:hypothetical protein
MRRRLLSLLFLFVLISAALGQAGSVMPQIPLSGSNDIDMATKKRVLISNYCRLDFEGMRLRPDGWNRLKPYVTMRTNPDYSRVVIVSRFDVETPEETAEVLYVNYREVGYYDELDGYAAFATSERVEFHIQEQQHGNEVLVTEISPGMPHVSPRAAIAWMNLRLADPKTSEVERTHLKDAVQRLNKFLLPPTPAAQPGK